MSLRSAPISGRSATRHSKQESRADRLASAVAEELEGRRLLATYAVTGIGDTGALAPTGGTGTVNDPFQIATLRSAVEQANTAAGADTITFAPALAGQTITLSARGNDAAGPAALPITTDITVQGLAGNAGITVAGGGSTSALRGFYVASTGTLSLSNLTISNFRALGGSGTFAGSGAGLGGAIFIDRGTLVVNNSTFDGNIAQGGVALDFISNPFAPAGGGLDPANGGAATGPNNFGGVGSDGVLPETDTGSIPGGPGGFGGGGGTQLGAGSYGGRGGFGAGGGSNNGPGGFGGGAGIGFVIGGGGAGMGGAIFSNGGAVRLVNSTFANNSAIGGTGGTSGQGLGGAVFNRDGALTVISSTLSSNIAAEGGRQIYALADGDHSGGDTTTSNSIAVTLFNSILAQSDTDVTDFVANAINGVTTGGITADHDIIRTSSGIDATVLTDDPKLALLASNGGPTQTFALLGGSPAYNTGNGFGNTLVTDQRGTGFPRIVGGTVDIGAFEVQIVPNHAPVGTNKSVTTLEDTDYTFSASDFGFSDPNDSPPDALLAVKIAAVPTAGTLKNNGLVVSVGQSISVADLNSGKMKFTPSINANGTLYASFQFKVQDDGGTANGGLDTDLTTRTLTININPVNHAPMGANKTVTTLEDTSYVFATSDFGFTDLNDSPSDAFSDVIITSLPSAGSLTDNGAAIVAGQSIPVAKLSSGKLKFTPAPNTTSSASFGFKVQDDGGTDNNGQDTDTTARTITINVNSVNDAPTGADTTINFVASTVYTLKVADFGFTDASDTPANGFANVKIATLPPTGVLKLGSTAVVNFQTISVAQIVANQLTYTPAPGTFGSSYTSFTFRVQDDGGAANAGVDTSTTPNKITFNVTVPAPQTSTLQAEDATFDSKSKVATDHSGYNGTGFVNIIPKNGFVQFAFNALTYGPSTKLEFRYANGSSSSRPMDVYVDNVKVGSLSFDKTGSWTKWSTASITLPLTPGAHAVKVVATGSSGGPNLDQLAVIPVAPTKPVKPTSLESAGVSKSQIKLKWKDNSLNETGFHVLRSTSSSFPTGATTVLFTLPANTTSFTDTELKSNTKYYYKIEAFNDVGGSGYTGSNNETTKK